MPRVQLCTPDHLRIERKVPGRWPEFARRPLCLQAGTSGQYDMIDFGCDDPVRRICPTFGYLRGATDRNVKIRHTIPHLHGARHNGWRTGIDDYSHPQLQGDPQNADG